MDSLDPLRRTLASFDAAVRDAEEWDRSTGDDAPRFSLLHQELAEGLARQARELVRERGLAQDGPLSHLAGRLEQAAARDRMEAHYLRDAVRAAREVQDRARTVVGHSQAAPSRVVVIEVPPPSTGGRR